MTPPSSALPVEREGEGLPNKDGLLSPTLSSIVPLAEREQRPLAFNEEFCLHSLSRPAWKTTLGTPDSPFYSGRVSGFLRFVGMVNAAIWFGAGIFFAAVILPAVFSPDMQKLLGPAAYPYYSGSVALVLFKRFFALQSICGAVALLHLFAETLYLGRPLPRLGIALVTGLFCFGLIGGGWLQPRMENLRQTMYFGPSPAQKEKARHSFGFWHGLSELVNLVVLGGLLVHFVQVTRPGEAVRHVGFTKFRS